MEPIRANSVSVARIYQARCHVPGCHFAGELLGDYQAANYDRQHHLEEHRQAWPEMPESGRPADD